MLLLVGGDPARIPGLGLVPAQAPTEDQAQVLGHVQAGVEISAVAGVQGVVAVVPAGALGAWQYMPVGVEHIQRDARVQPDGEVLVVHLAPRPVGPQ